LPPEGVGDVSDAAQEGSAGHHIIAECLQVAGTPQNFDLSKVGNPHAYLDTDVRYDPEAPPWRATIDLINGCVACVDKVVALVRQYEQQGFRVEMYVETRAYPGQGFYSPRDDCWGTSDVILLLYYGDALVLIEVIDHKLGVAVYVDASSGQLLLYGIGALVAHAGLTPETWPTYGLRCTVLQPRHHSADSNNPARSKDWTLLEVQEFMAQASLSAAATDDPNAPRIPGEKQCQWCRFKPHCPELRAQSLIDASHVFHDMPVQPLPTPEEEKLLNPEAFVQHPDHLRVETLTRIMEAAPLIRTWLKAVEEHADKLAKSGTRIPGWKLVEGQSKRQFVDQEAARNLFAKTNRNKQAGGGKIPKPEWATETLITPYQAELRIKPQIGVRAWNKIEALIRKPSGALILVPESDSRKEVAMDARVFDDIQEGVVVANEANEVNEANVETEQPLVFPMLS
jgi:hypothetical protein